MHPGSGAPIRGAGAAGERPRIAVTTYNVIPRIDHTFKYEHLGQMALENRRAPQNKTPDAPVQRGDLSRYLYGPEDVQADDEADR